MISRARGPARLTADKPWRDVGQAHVESPVGQPPREPLVDGAGAARRGGHVERVVVEPADRAVVHDPPRVAGDHAVADAARLQVREAVRVEAVEELAGVGAAHDQLAERRDVDQAGGLVHGQRLGLRVAVVVGAPPVARPHHRRAELAVAAVDRRALGGLERAARRARPSARRARAAARSSCRPPPGSGPSPAPSAARRAAGTCGPGTGPSWRSCSAWTARSSRSPPRPRGGCPSRSRPRTGRRSTCRCARARDRGRHGHVGRRPAAARAAPWPSASSESSPKPSARAAARPAARAGALRVLERRRRPRPRRRRRPRRGARSSTKQPSSRS